MKKFKGEALLIVERNVCLDWIRDTVKVDAGGQIPLGICYFNATNIAANYNNGDIIGTALGIPIKLDTSLTVDNAKFVDSEGTTISTYP